MYRKVAFLYMIVRCCLKLGINGRNCLDVRRGAKTQRKDENWGKLLFCVVFILVGDIIFFRFTSFEEVGSLEVRGSVGKFWKTGL